MLKLAGEAESEKFAAGTTVKETLVELNRLPDVPVTVTENVPVAAEEEAVRVNWVVEADGLGLNEAVSPSGRGDAVNMTVPLKAFCAAAAIVLVAEFP